MKSADDLVKHGSYDVKWIGDDKNEKVGLALVLLWYCVVNALCLRYLVCQCMNVAVISFFYLLRKSALLLRS